MTSTRSIEVVEESGLTLLMLDKTGERYVFLFDDAHRTEALRTLGRFASNSDLSFSWWDAAVLSKKIREQRPNDKTFLSKLWSWLVGEADSAEGEL